MNKLTFNDFKGMIASGANNLTNNENLINTLNVFPVPDGDTGTNMSMTFANGAKEVNNCFSNNVGDGAKVLSRGLLMGARGNSGVITSQIFRGFAKYTAGKEELTPKEIAEAFIEGAKVAYKAIMKPVEGTILTVIREAAWYADHDFIANPNIDVKEYFDNLVKYAKESLETTPDLLPALKEAGVVDSGGAGLLKIFEGFKAYFDGNPIQIENGTIQLNEVEEEILEGYKLELNLTLNNEYISKFDRQIVTKRLLEVGKAINIKENNNTVEVTINSLKPGEVLNILQRYGEFHNIKIVNNNLKENALPEKEYGIISVASGEGLTKLFYELGSDIVITGGQTMNPSTSDFINSIDSLNAKTIFIFPNNSNIILAASQAGQLSNKKVIVIPTKSIQAGLSCLALFDSNSDASTNENNLTNNASYPKTASITYAVKDTSFDGVEVKEGDYISLVDKTILASSNDLKETITKTIDALNQHKDRELLTVIYGEGYKEEINEYIKDYASNNTNFELELIKGDQPVYSYLLSLE